MKGILIGLAVCAVGSAIYIAMAMGPLEAHKATGLSVITARTIHQAGWWVACVMTIGASHFLFKK